MHVVCPQCQNTLTLADGADSAACPACGSAVRSGDAVSTTAFEDAPRTVGRFLLLAEVGSGAFGTTGGAPFAPLRA